MWYWGTSYRGDDHGYRRQMGLATLVTAGLILALILGWEYLDSYEGTITGVRKSSYRGRYGRNYSYYVYYDTFKGKHGYRKVRHSVYNRARPGLIIHKDKRTFHVDILEPAEYAARLRKADRTVPESVSDLAELRRKARERAEEAQRKLVAALQPGALAPGVLPPRPAGGAPSEEPAAPGGKLAPLAPPAAAPAVAPAVAPAAPPARPPETAPAPPPDQAPPEPAETAPAGPEAAQPAPGPPSAGMTTVYIVTLASGRKLVALECEESGVFMKLTLPRGIRTTLAKGTVLDVRAEQVETASLERQVDDMRRRMEEAKRRERLETLLKSRR